MKPFADDTIFNRPKTGMIPDYFTGGIEIELSNHCNARCYFCPRDLVHDTGFMSEADFATILAQASDYPDKLYLMACGHGESILHPKLGDFIACTRERGLPFALQTNGSLLTPERRRVLLDAGLSVLRVSVSALGELYEQIYQLPFDAVVRNVTGFVREARGRCRVDIYIVQTDMNRHLIPGYRDFWQEIGVDRCDVFPVNNRAGSIPDKNRIYTATSESDTANTLIADHGFTTLCTVAAHGFFVGHDGNHYLCPNDWEKRIALGHVSRVGLNDVAKRKLAITARREASICATCDMDIANRIKDCLRAGDSAKQLDQLLKQRTQEEQFLQQWKAHLDGHGP